MVALAMAPRVSTCNRAHDGAHGGEPLAELHTPATTASSSQLMAERRWNDEELRSGRLTYAPRVAHQLPQEPVLAAVCHA